MLYYRLKKNADFQKLFAKGKKAHTHALTVLYSPAKRTTMGICVGKKHGKAVQRNRIKRLLREAFRKHVSELNAAYAFVLLPKVQEKYSFAEYEKCIDRIFRKEKLVSTLPPSHS